MENPTIPFIQGDGTGPDIWAAASRVFDAAIQKAFQGKRKIDWLEVLAGQKAKDKYNEWLPQETLDTIKKYGIAIKGPLTTPVGGGLRSLNVTLRQVFDLYACVRPVRYFQNVPSPLKNPQKLNIVIFRENTEDVYAGIEWQAGTPEAKKILDFLKKEMKVDIRLDSGIGIKPISSFGTKRLVRRAIQYAIKHKKDSVTLVHKGNIMKFTEGAFREWGYEVAREEFSKETLTEEQANKNRQENTGKIMLNKVLIKDRIADNMFQQILLRPDEYSVLALPNLNGDYISDASAAQVGGLGIAPGANIGDQCAIFEATHGTAPKYAGQDKVNPSSVILSGVMMFEYMGWQEAGDMIVKAMEKTFLQNKFTYDLARDVPGSKLLKCSEFGTAIIENM